VKYELGFYTPEDDILHSPASSWYSVALNPSFVKFATPDPGQHRHETAVVSCVLFRIDSQVLKLLPFQSVRLEDHRRCCASASDETFTAWVVADGTQVWFSMSGWGGGGGGQ
jgi:hypothetical protein